MALPPTSRVSFLRLDGSPLSAPEEWQPALMQLHFPLEDLDVLSVKLQGQMVTPFLKTVAGEKRLLVEWARANPGNYAVSIQHGVVRLFEPVKVAPRKLSPERFEALLEDLSAALPTQVAIALQRAGAFAGVNIIPPQEVTVAAELLRLRRAVDGTESRPGLARVLETLAPDPHRVLVTQEELVGSERARRPHPARLGMALRGHNLDARGLPLKVLDRRSDHSSDVYENRLLKTFHTQVDLRLRRLVKRLEGNTYQGDAQELLSRLARARRAAAFLDSVSLPAYLPERVTMVLLKLPPYRAAFEGYLELHRALQVRLEEARLESPLENLPKLYQLWGTLRVIESCVRVGAALGYRLEFQHLVERRGDELFLRVLPDGRAALALKHPHEGVRVTLTPERVYGKSGALRSISYQQRPDIAIEITYPDGKTHVLLFDPKYKLEGEALEDAGDDTPVGQPKKVDIDKMHSYRDSIRDAGGERVVVYAAVLHPGETVDYGGDLGAITALPLTGGLEERLSEVLHRVLRLE